MRLVFIRHAEPDYEHDCLTEKGYREADILAKRVASWEHVRKIYVSPVPRAQMTAAPSLALRGETAETIEWLEEFRYYTPNPVTGKMHVPWDLQPEYFTPIDEMYDPVRWQETEFYTTHPGLVPGYRDLCESVDALLAGYGYVREGRMYRLDPEKTDGDDEDMIVLFCHFGITNFILSHMIGISPAILCMNFLSLPTGITVVNAEKSAEGNALWRIQFYGDTSHLREAGEPVSASAAWSTVFQG